MGIVKCQTNDWWFLLCYSNHSAYGLHCLPLLGPYPIIAHCSAPHALADSLWLLLDSGSFSEVKQTSGCRACWLWYFHVRLASWDQNVGGGERLWRGEGTLGNGSRRGMLSFILWWMPPAAYPQPLHSGSILYVHNILQFLKCTFIWLSPLFCEVGRIINLIL